MPFSVDHFLATRKIYVPLHRQGICLMVECCFLFINTFFKEVKIGHLIHIFLMSTAPYCKSIFLIYSSYNKRSNSFSIIQFFKVYFIVNASTLCLSWHLNVFGQSFKPYNLNVVFFFWELSIRPKTH